MVVPTYLGAMTLGGMPGLSGLQLSGANLQQYNNLLMSNFTQINPALQLSSLPNQLRWDKLVLAEA